MIFVEVRSSWGFFFFFWGGGDVNYVMPFVIDKTHCQLNWFVSVYVLYGIGISCVSLGL